MRAVADREDDQWDAHRHGQGAGHECGLVGDQQIGQLAGMLEEGVLRDESAGGGVIGMERDRRRAECVVVRPSRAAERDVPGECRAAERAPADRQSARGQRADGNAANGNDANAQATQRETARSNPAKANRPDADAAEGNAPNASSRQDHFRFGALLRPGNGWQSDGRRCDALELRAKQCGGPAGELFGKGALHPLAMGHFTSALFIFIKVARLCRRKLVINNVQVGLIVDPK